MDGSCYSLWAGNGIRHTNWKRWDKRNRAGKEPLRKELLLKIAKEQKIAICKEYSIATGTWNAGQERSESPWLQGLQCRPTATGLPGHSLPAIQQGIAKQSNRWISRELLPASAQSLQSPEPLPR